jgi:hypothetical protein
MKAIYAQACFSSSSLPVADMRILTIAAVFAALCPTASMACRQPMSPMARLTMLISDPHRLNMTPRPSVVAGDNCPDRDQLPDFRRCDSDATRDNECVSGNHACDGNGYCECRPASD